VIHFVQLLAEALQVQPKLEFQAMQPGDVPATCTGITRLRERICFEPSTPLREGLQRFTAWFLAHEGRRAFA
jgi:UDP-glucuronate 4-epimerase